MTSAPSLAVVIPARDAADTLAAQLDAVLAGADGVDLEVIVVDNGSTDRTAEVVRSFAERDGRVSLMTAANAHGPCHARNVGIEAAGHENIALCDADDVVAPGWAAAMARALGDHDYVTGPLDLDLLNPEWVRHSRGATSFFNQTPRFGGSLPFANSCNVGMRKAAWRAAGGFDERIFPGDDVDFGMRMWRAGVALHFDPDVEVHYRYRTSLGALVRQSYRYGQSWPRSSTRMHAGGLTPPSRVAGLRRLGWLVRNLPLLRHRAGRARWIWVLANEAGRVRGSIRQRSLYL